MRLSRSKTADNRSIHYPANCKEINENLATDDLVRRLRDISMAFRQLKQDEDNSQYLPLVVLLSNDYYLEHPSHDVKLLVACSIADIFRVYAPNSPYQNDELIKKIFHFFIQQLKGLQNPNHPTFKRYFYLLENLARFKSFNICIKLEESQSIFCELFSLIFSIVNDNHSEKVRNLMVDMLTPLVSESSTTSSELMEIILKQLIEPEKSHSKNACLLAREVIKKSIKTLGPHLANHLATAFTSDISSNGEELLVSVNSSSHTIESNSQSANYFRNNNSGICDIIYKLNTSYIKQVFLVILVIISFYAFMFQNKPTENNHKDGKRENEIKINLEQVNRLNLNYPGLLTAKQLRLIKARIAVMESEVSILMLLGKTRDSHCKLDPTFCVGRTIANVTQLQFGYIDASDPYLNSNELKNELGRALDNYKNPVIIDSLEQLPGSEVMSLFQFIDKDESHQRSGMLILIVYTGNYQNEAEAPIERLKEADIAEKILLDRWSYFIPRDSLTSVLSRMCGSIVKVY